MIPRKIWQTYKLPRSELPEYAVEAVKTWQKLNVGWEYVYMDDSECESFVLEAYGLEWHRIFMSCPVGVMRGDLWRYLIVAKHGGFYADLDTICIQPIDSWLDPSWRMVINPEHSRHFCQWAFGAEQGHPLLYAVLEAIRRAFDNPDYSNPHFVHALTGPAIWTSAIMTRLGFEDCDLTQSAERINGTSSARELGLVVHPDPRFFHEKAIRHLYGSQSWTDGRYVQWIKEREGVTLSGSRLPASVRIENEMESTFKSIYANNTWGGSGPGSRPDVCASLIDSLEDYARRHGIRSICDLGCGDLQWIPRLVERTGIYYVGIDVVPELIRTHRASFPKFEFLHLDLFGTNPLELPDADLYFAKDVFQHWPSDAVEYWIEAFFRARPSARLVVANCAHQSSDTRNLELGGFAPLGGDFLPLRRFRPTELCQWDSTKRAYLIRPRISYSQASQDLFARTVLYDKRDGYYVDVGANLPFEANNSYVLERDLGWRGISVDIDPRHVEVFNRFRRNKCIATDATAFEFLDYFEREAWPTQIDYLSIDCEPAAQSLACLERLVHGSYRFSVITFEHEHYREGVSVRDKSRAILLALGYELVVSDLMCDGCRFEDWYVDPGVVPEVVRRVFMSDSIDHRRLMNLSLR